MVRLLLADDHDVVRRGLRDLLEERAEWVVCAEARDGRTAVALALEHRPDVVVLDVLMPELNGLEVAVRVPKSSPGTKVLILSMHAEDSYVRQAMRAGVAGYLLKGAAVSELPLALQSVMRGEKYLTPRVSQTVVEGMLSDRPAGSDPLDGLTQRQREIALRVRETREAGPPGTWGSGVSAAALRRPAARRRDHRSGRGGRSAR